VAGVRGVQGDSAEAQRLEGAVTPACVLISAPAKPGALFLNSLNSSNSLNSLNSSPL
jgi:hypothetical protein